MKEHWEQFGEYILDLYTTSDCYLLVHYLQKEFVDSEIYLLEMTDNTVVHGLLFYKEYYYDIQGRFESNEEIINYWIYTNMLDMLHDEFRVRPIKLNEKTILEYTEEAHLFTINFVKANKDKLVY